MEAEIERFAVNQLPGRPLGRRCAKSVTQRRSVAFLPTSLLRETDRADAQVQKEKAGAQARVFFTKVKEELQFIPPIERCFEYWQEKAVFEQDGPGTDSIAAPRPE